MAAYAMKIGQSATLVIDAHSTLNGAKIPEGSTVALTSNDTTVATVPAMLTVPLGGVAQLRTSVTVLAVGATDVSVHIVDPAGTVFDGVATLLVEPAPEPGMVRIEVSFEIV